MTWCPSFTRRRTKCEPTNPAPPVTKIIFLCSMLCVMRLTVMTYLQLSYTQTFLVFLRAARKKERRCQALRQGQRREPTPTFLRFETFCLRSEHPQPEKKLPQARKHSTLPKKRPKKERFVR